MSSIKHQKHLGVAAKLQILVVFLFCVTVLNINSASGFHLSENNDPIDNYSGFYNDNNTTDTTPESTEIDDINFDIISDNIREDTVVSVTTPTMDLITIVWYFSTFLALVAFFIVMACSDGQCRRERKTEITPETAPPTPAPSYREFAPPSYDTVMRKNKNRIFIVPIRDKVEGADEVGVVNSSVVAHMSASDIDRLPVPVHSVLHHENEVRR